jgi:phospholipid/cholesterol/gamma-HCH transport system substrate-binding protein
MIEAGRRVSLLVGALVLAVGTTLALILIFLGTATRIFGSTVSITVCFSDVTGLRSGAAVLASGVGVGAVASVALGGACDARARVELAVDRDVLERLSADSRARLVTMGLLGDRVVALVSGQARARLRRGAVLEGEVPPDASAAVAQAGEAFDVLTRIARRIDATLTEADLRHLLANIATTAQALRQVLERAERGPGLLHLLIFDPRLERQAQAIGPAIGQVAAAAGDAQRLMAQLERAAGDLAQIVAYVKSGQGTLGGVIYDPAIYEDLRTIVGRVRRSVILRTLARFVLRHR